MRSNPFGGNAISPEQLEDKRLLQIKDRIINGESFMFTGSPCSGKTSILNYLRTPIQKATYENRLIFSLVDIPSIGEYEDVHFWREVLTPLQEEIAYGTVPTSLSQAYQACEAENFKKLKLEKLFLKMKQSQWQLVLMLDGFEALLEHPYLDNQAFLGGLRQLVTHSQGTLVLITTANVSLTEIFSHHNLTGSLFNFMTEEVLGLLSDTEIDKSLAQGEAYFTKDDCCFIKKIAGEHPYLLRRAASILWQIYNEGQTGDSIQQRLYQEFQSQTWEFLKTNWKIWAFNLDYLKAFTSVALIHLAREGTLKLIPSLENKLIENINCLVAECNKLRKLGFIVHSNNDWQVLPSVFLTFVAVKLREISGPLNESSYENWLRSQNPNFQDGKREPASSPGSKKYRKIDR